MEDIMEQKIWSKTLLTCYGCLEKIADAIDHLVYLNGINSGCFKSDAFNCANKIIELTERKKLLINLKIITEDVLANLQPQYAKILVLKYFDRVKTEECAKIVCLSKRTFFRKLNNAIDSFCCKLNNMGYTSEKLAILTKSEKWIADLFSSLYQQEINKSLKQKNDVVDEMSLLGYAFNSLKKISGFKPLARHI